MGWPSVAVLFARSDSIYKGFSSADVFDLERDALTFYGGRPVVAHPPCRAWGRLRHLAKPRADEKQLALFAVHAVRRNGGVLEHPAKSSLWAAAGLPLPGCRDGFGGWTLGVHQSDFGHSAPKATWLYIVGVEPRDIPPLPFDLADPVGRIENMTRADRERTPGAFAVWLLQLAHLVKAPAPQSGIPAGVLASNTCRKFSF